MDIKKDFTKFALGKGIPSIDTHDYINKATDKFAPYILEERQLNCQPLDIFSRMLYDRIIFLSGVIDNETSDIVIAQLLYLDSLEKKDINFYIKSPGGIINDGLAIYDTMNFIKSDISTIGMGVVASMASILLMSGKKGKRLALPNSSIMIHQPSGGTEGKSTDMEIAVKEIIKLRKKCYDIIVKNTDIKNDMVDELCKIDTWIEPADALKYKIIDKII